MMSWTAGYTTVRFLDCLVPQLVSMFLEMPGHGGDKR